MLQPFMTEKVVLRKKNGERHEFRANVQPTKIMTDQANLLVEEGDFIERALPNGMVETYFVTDRRFYASFQGIPAHYQMKVRKESARDATRKPAAAQIYTIRGSPNARITIQSTDNSVNVHSVTDEQLFVDMANAVKEQVPDEKHRAEMLAALEDLQHASTKQSFGQKYQRLMSIAADHITVLMPFLSALAAMAINTMK